MKLLVVEDDQAVAQSLQLLFSSYNYAVDIAADGEVGLQMTEMFEYDLILLDVILPRLDGVSLCQHLRAQGFQKPILLLTGQGEGRQKAIALNAGADDYVVKPFDAEELVARVQALLRRGDLTNQPTLSWGNLSIDPSNRKVSYGTRWLAATPKEYAILELFLRNPQKTLSAAVILDHVWSSAESPGEETVRVHIKELRHKLTKVGAPKDFIKTIYRVGYQLNPRYSNLLAVQVKQQPTALQIAELAAVNEQLRIALEQLRITQDELLQQNEQLQAAQTALSLERQQYRDLFEFAPDAYLVTDRYGMIQDANREASHLLNIKPEHLIGKPLVVFVDRGDRSDFRLRLASSHFAQDWEVNLKPRKGEPFPVLVAATQIKNMQDELISLRWSFRDIRVRKEAEQQLRTSRDDLEMRVAERTAELVFANQVLQQRKEFLNSIFEGADQAVFVIEVTEANNFRYSQFNRLAEQFAGSSTQSMHGKTPEEVFGTEIGAGFRQNYERCLQAGRSISYEEYIVFDSHTIWTLTTLSPLRDDQGRIYRIIGTAVDISDRKQAEVALQQSEAEFRSMFNVTSAGMAQADPQTRRFLQVNAAFCAITGYSEAELLNLTVDELNHPDDCQLDQDRYTNLLQGANYQSEKRYLRKDGTAVWVIVTGNIIYDAEGRPLRAFSMIQDISDRKRLEIALQEREELLRLALDLNHVGLWEWQVATGASNWNDYHYRLLGYEPGEVEPSYLLWRRHIHPDDLSTVEQELVDALQNRTDYEAEFRVVLSNGEIRWHLSKGRGLYNATGNPVRMIGIVFDVSDRKQAELAFHQTQATIRQQLAEIEAIYQTAPVGLAILDRDLRFVRLNQQLAEMNGFSIEAHIGRTIHEIVPTVAEGVESLFRQVLATGEPLLNLEIVGETAAQPGVQRIWLENWFPLKDDGQILGINIVVQEITELKRTEFVLQQQIRQEYLLADIAQDIRCSLSLTEVLSRTVHRVREFLNADRVVIFRFRPDWQGDVIMESVGEEWTSILSTTIFDPCFRDRYIEPYRQGRVASITNIDTQDLETCYVELLKPFQVKAVLVVPILQNDQLWGLLISHQCSAPRQWLPAEIALLRRLATQVSIAIQQSELYEQTRRELIERKRIQNILEASEERFRSLSAAAPIGICQANADGICLYSNSRWQEMSGLSFADSLGNGWLQAIHPEDRPMVMRAWEHYLHHQREWVPEFRLLTPEGEIRWVFARVSPIQSTVGETMGFVSTYEDITERKRAEIQLQRMSNALSNAVEGISQLDEQGRYISVNEAYARIVGYKPEEILGMNWQQTVHPDDLASVEAAYQQMLHQGKVELEARGIRKDGSVFYKRLSMVTILDEQQQFAGHYCFIKDITEKKQLAVERQLAEDKIREQAALLDIASDAIAVRDLNHYILYWNQGAERLYGWSAEEAIGQSAHQLLQEQDSPIEEIMQRLLTWGNWQGEMNNRTKTGQQVTVEARWTLARDNAGQPEYILAVNTDITEKKQLEAQFYRAQRLESLGTLASGIAHDLNNVLTPILAISQLLGMNRATLDARSREMLKVLEDSAKRGASMIKQILTFTRGTDGECKPLQVTAVLQEVVRVVQQTFPKPITLRTNIPEHLPWTVSADSTYLHQVLMNLCVNARDAMPRGGVLTLSVEHCFVDQAFAQTNLDAQIGNYVVVTIADTGTGMSPEVRDRIFDPFFTTKPPGQGTGLGLATVLGIVKHYGGFLQVFTEVGRGTEVKVYLPAIEGMLPPASPSEQDWQGNGELVLLVDDDVAVQRSTQAMLESHQYTVLATNDGSVAIALYTQHQAEVRAVILDIMMPNMSGVTLIQTLKEINPRVQIIAMSGIPANREQALAAGAAVFLTKPYNLNSLLKNLDALVNA